MKTSQLMIRLVACLSLLSGLEAAYVDYQKRDDAQRMKSSLVERQEGAATKDHYTIGILVYQGFEPLDVWGPIEFIAGASFYKNITLSIISKKTGPVGVRTGNHQMGGPILDLSHMINTQIVATHNYNNHPKLDILIVPGGMGQMYSEQNGDTDIEDFVRKRYKKLDYLLSVCSGALTLAKAGALNGKKATTNKAAWAWATGAGKNVKWQASARWVVDGNTWTSSGVSAGMDMTHAFLKHLYGATLADSIVNGAEYVPHQNPTYDPFSIIFDVPGHNKNGSITECSKPAGY